jgi:hypothetical protein
MFRYMGYTFGQFLSENHFFLNTGKSDYYKYEGNE